MSISKIVSRSLQRYWRISRGLTLEARVALIHADGGGVWLIRSPEHPAWQFPGGRVKAHETVAGALARELAAQLELTIEGQTQLFGIYIGTGEARGNHTVLVVNRTWRPSSNAPQSAHVVEHGVFAPNKLPPDTCPATRQRILEILGQTPRASVW